METTQPDLTESDDQQKRTPHISPHDIGHALEASRIVRENKTHTVRTRELDNELEKCKQVINGVLSRHAHDAVEALNFMFIVVPTQVSQLSQIFAAHRFTYMPMVDTLNQIAHARQKAQEGEQDGKEEQRSPSN